MAGVLLLLFLVVPIAELAVIVQVGQAIGTLSTIAVLLLISVVGATLMKREGLGVLHRARSSLASGRVPGREVADGFLIVLGGALMLTPGFLTDVVGLALLLPPVRALVRPFLLRQLQARAVVAVGSAAHRGPGASGRSGVIDV